MHDGEIVKDQKGDTANDMRHIVKNCVCDTEDCTAIQTGPSCSKLKTSLVNVLLKFQTFISEYTPIFFVEKMCEAFARQKLLLFLQQKISVYLVMKS